MSDARDWAAWTAQEVAEATYEIETFREGEEWVALKYQVYDGPECHRTHLVEEGRGRTDQEAIARLQPVRS